MHFIWGNPEVLAEGLAEVSLVIKAPGICDFADGTVAGMVATQLATAVFQALDQYPLHEMLRLVGKKLMDVTSRQPDGLGYGLHIDIRIVHIGRNEFLDPAFVIHLQMGVVVWLFIGKRLQCRSQQIDRRLGDAFQTGGVHRPGLPKQGMEQVGEDGEGALVRRNVHCHGMPPVREATDKTLLVDAEKQVAEATSPLDMHGKAVAVQDDLPRVKVDFLTPLPDLTPPLELQLHDKPVIGRSALAFDRMRCSRRFPEENMVDCVLGQAGLKREFVLRLTVRLQAEMIEHCLAPIGKALRRGERVGVECEVHENNR